MITLVNLELENGALGHICSSFAADDPAPSPLDLYREGHCPSGNHALHLQ